MYTIIGSDPRGFETQRHFRHLMKISKYHKCHIKFHHKCHNTKINSKYHEFRIYHKISIVVDKRLTNIISNRHGSKMSSSAGSGAARKFLYQWLAGNFSLCGRKFQEYYVECQWRISVSIFICQLNLPSC